MFPRQRMALQPTRPRPRVPNFSKRLVRFLASFFFIILYIFLFFLLLGTQGKLPENIPLGPSGDAAVDVPAVSSELSPFQQLISLFRQWSNAFISDGPFAASVNSYLSTVDIKSDEAFSSQQSQLNLALALVESFNILQANPVTDPIEMANLASDVSKYRILAEELVSSLALSSDPKSDIPQRPPVDSVPHFSGSPLDFIKISFPSIYSDLMSRYAKGKKHEDLEETLSNQRNNRTP